MGCSDCGRAGGCSTRKEGERELLAEILPRLYPTRRWGEPDDTARHGQGVPSHEGRRLARQVAAVLEAPVYFRAGEDDENCDFIYVLCVGRAPGLVELRDAVEVDPLAVGDADGRISERYLRACVSTMARVATLQEVVLDLETGDEVAIVERPRAGVFDPILLKRTQKLVDLLVGADIAYLDFGIVAKPPLAERYGEFDGAEYARAYGEDPAIVNYLFYPHPPTAVTTRFVPRRATVWTAPVGEPQAAARRPY